MTTSSRTGIVLSMLAALAVSTSSAAAGTVKLSTVAAKAYPVAAANGPANQYDTDNRITLACKGKATALMAGWSGALAPVDVVTSQLVYKSPTLSVSLRRPMTAGTFRAVALCARGPLKAQQKIGPSGDNSSVSCGARQLAIGLPISNGPYWAQPVASKPQGLRGWVNSEGKYGRAAVICVAAGAFAKAQLVRQSATFSAGARTATVAAACTGGRRPISWGFEAGTLDQNIWRSVESSATMTAPFIAASKARGRSGWALTFATPDGAGARSATDIAIHLTCAIPR